MNSATPIICDARTAICKVFDEDDIDDEQVRNLLWAFASEPEERLAVFVDGDWHFDGAGMIDMEALFGNLTEQVPEDKRVCALVIRGNLSAPHAVLCDRDRDWAPSLIVGGNVKVHGLALGGGHTRIVGDLTAQGTVYGSYNHGELDVLGTTTASLILSDDFGMGLYGPVDCPHVLSYYGDISIKERDAQEVERLLDRGLFDAENCLDHDAVLDALEGGRSLLKEN